MPHMVLEFSGKSLSQKAIVDTADVLTMGVGRRMKKQGPPAPLEELNPAFKRKASEVITHKGSARKRRRAGEDEIVSTNAEKVNGVTRKNSGPENLRTEFTMPVKSIARAGSGQLSSDNSSEDRGNEKVSVAINEFDGIRDNSHSDLEIDARDESEIEAVDSDDSVFDSEQENGHEAMFSEDENESDAEKNLTAANIEGLSRKLDKQKAEVAEEAQMELEDDALQTNIASEEGVVDGAHQNRPGLAPDMQLLRTRITNTIRILGDFSHLAERGKSRADYTSLLLSDICTYYGYTPYLAEKLLALFTPLEAFAFFEANESPRPVVLRTNTLRTSRRSLAQALINRGVVLEPIGKWSKVGLQVFESAVPLGATPEYLAGHYILQAASSFLPVLALGPQPNERVLDMAAAPGGKTTYICALMRNTGAIFANDANKQRAKGLIGNIHRLGCKNCIVSNLDAKKAFPRVLGGFDRVLLDAPCSGTGVIGKDPSVKTSKSERDFLALPHMQKQLLLAAIDSVDHASKTGGYIVYSTCSVTVEENEGVVQYALRKRPNVKIVDTGLGTFGSEGYKKYMNKRFDEKMSLTRRYFPHRENVDGFFVCKLKKVGPTSPASVLASRSAESNATVLKNTDKESMTNHLEDANGEEPGDDFGGFDSEEDATYVENAERKWLRGKGLNPKLAGRKLGKERVQKVRE